jgi:dihydrofolate reductase
LICFLACTIFGMKSMAVHLIAAVARNGGIGKNNQLLVHLPGDLPRFKKFTWGCPVIMGRKTWDSLGRALPGRRNVVITRNPLWEAQDAHRAESLTAALALVAKNEVAFVIGGAQIYAQAMPLACKLILTEIHADLEADAFFPAWEKTAFVPMAREDHCTEKGLGYSFTEYIRKGS